LLFAKPCIGQYYLRGEVKDEKNLPLSNARIFVHSAKSYFYTGAYGSFGFTVMHPYDSITVDLDGYEPKSMRVKSDIWQNIFLKISPTTASKSKPKLISVTKDYKQQSKFSLSAGNETYFQLVENEFVKAAGYPNTGFSMNVNKASYSNIRRFLNMNSPVPPDAVRVEEMVNYFNLHYREPSGDDLFHFESQMTSCPWNVKQELLFLNISAKKLNLDNVPPANFVFLIDVSGSMDSDKRLPLLKAAFQMFIKNLRDKDIVSIVMYGGTVGVWLEPTLGSEKEKISKAIEALTAAGDTPGESAIRAAYQLASRTFIPGGNNRVILATDGDFNVGESSEKALDELISKQRQTGVYLTCLGVGMGNLKDSKLQTLAKRGNGNYAYLDDIHEAEKVLVKELTQTFYAVADDVYMNVEFNPAMVMEYRLIGFDNKKEIISSATTELEGGEIGSGSSIMAIFEVIPTEQYRLTKNTGLKEDIGKVNLVYTSCNDSSQHDLKYPLLNNFQPIDSIHPDFRFATAVTMFGLKLKQSRYLDLKHWAPIKNIARNALQKDDYLQNEFLLQLDKAEQVYEPRKKKKRRKNFRS